MNFGDAIARVKAQGGFDVPDDEAGSWVLDAYRTMVARSKWRQTIRELGLTVEGQSTIDVADDIVDVLELAVEGVAYGRISTRDLWGLKNGRQRLLAPGAFAPMFADDGDAASLDQIEFYPGPTISGYVISGLVAVLPPELTSGQAFAVPEDLHERIVDGAASTGLLRKDERPDLAAGYQAKFDEAVAELTRRRTSRIGSGPSQAQVYF